MRSFPSVPGVLVAAALAACGPAATAVPDLAPSRDLAVAQGDLAAWDAAARPPDLATAPGPCDGGALNNTLVRLAPAALRDYLAGHDPVLINVHIPWAGDIPGTDARIAYTDVDAIERQLGSDRCVDVILYCLGGPMSVEAGDKLIARGYLRVRDLLGGLAAWEQAGYPVQR